MTEECDAASTVDVAVIAARLEHLSIDVDRQMKALKEATAFALSSVEKATALSQATADRAMARAEAAADRAYLEQMISALRNNFGDQIQNLREMLTQSMTSGKEAVNKAEAATEKRFEGVNEFRAQLSDQASRFMPRQEAEALSRANAEKIDALAARVDRAEGRSSGFSSGGAGLAQLIAVIATVVTIGLAILAFNN